MKKTKVRKEKKLNLTEENPRLGLTGITNIFTRNLENVARGLKSSKK